MASLRRQYYKSYIEFKQSDAFKSLSAEERAQINKTAKQTYQQLSDDEAPMLEGQALRDQRGVLSNVVTDLTSGVINLGRAGVSGAAWAADVAGFPDAARSLDEKSQQMGSTAQMISPPADPDRLMDFGSQSLLQNVPTFAAGGVLAKLLTGSAAGGAMLNNARNAVGISSMAGAAPLSESAASFLSTTGLYGVPAVRQANVEDEGQIRSGNPYFEFAAAIPYALIENTLGVTPLKTMRAFSGGAAPAGVAKTITANAGKIGAWLEQPIFELSGKVGAKGAIGALARFIGENILGEATEEVFQGIEEIAVPHFAKKPIGQAIKDTIADLGKTEVYNNLLTQAKGGAIVGGILGGANSIARKITSISDKINDPETTPEEAQKLAAAKKQLKDEMLQLTYNQNIPTVQPSGPTITDPTMDSYAEPEGISIHPQQIFGGPAPEVLYPNEQPPQNIGTEGTMRDYAAYKQDKQATIEEQNATPIAVLRKIAAMKSVPDSDPQKQRFMKFLADRNWLPQEATEYPAGRVGRELQALDAAEMMPETLVSAEAEPETPLLPYQPNQAEGRILADNGGVILPTKNEDLIMPKSGRPFANQKIAKAYQTKNEMKDTHVITPVRGGFALMKKPAQQQAKRITVEIPRGGTYDKMTVSKNIPTENRMRVSGMPGVAERIEKKLAPNVTLPVESKTGSTINFAIQSQIDAGWNPKWPFVPADLGNKSFVEAIKFDPEISEEERERILSFVPGQPGYKRLMGDFSPTIKQPAVSKTETVKVVKQSEPAKQKEREQLPEAEQKLFTAQLPDGSTVTGTTIYRAEWNGKNSKTGEPLAVVVHSPTGMIASRHEGPRSLDEAKKQAEQMNIDKAIQNGKKTPPAPPPVKAELPQKPEAVTKSAYTVKSSNGGFRVLDPQGKQYSWHTSKQAADDKAAELNGNKTEQPEQKNDATTDLEGAKRTLAELKNREKENGMVADDRLLKKIAAYEKIIREAEAELAQKEEDNDQPEVAKTVYQEQTETLGKIIQMKLEAGEYLEIKELYAIANEVFEGTQADGVWNIKDLYDSLELGINLYLLNNKELVNLFNSGDIASFISKVKTDVLLRIPTQTKRTEEMDEFQQFSTPPSIAAMVGWLANINSRDTVLEPSAGIGGLAVFGKLAGANVIVNEFSKRRAEVLSNMPFDRVFTENGEQLNNILPDDVAPTIVVMNPPFSSTAGRIQGQRKTMNGGIHVEQALKKLQPGGRLVAIVGDGMSFEHSTFKDWWVKIRKEYNVKANIGLSGQEYKKYGTTFDNRILVIDKTGETTGQPAAGNYNNIESALKALEGVRNERPAVSRTAESTEGTDQQKSSGAFEKVRPSSSTRPSSSSGPVSSSTTSKTDTASKADERGAVSSNTGRVDIQKPRKSDGVSGTKQTIQPGSKTGNAGSNVEGNGRNTSPESIREDREPGLELSKAESAKNTELTDSIYDEYEPSTSIKGAQKHPGKLVESAAMAAVSPAKVSYVPKIPKEAIDSGKISDAQLEAVIRAGHNHDQKLMDGKRKGFFIGDGTGVGKGREIAAIFWDNWNQGRKRGVWITKNSGLFNSAKRDIDGIGWNKNVALTLKDYEDIPNTDGILLVSYDTLKGMSKKDGRTRLEQIEKWLGDDFDGLIAFDEAHMMANGIDVKGARGTKKASQKALKALDFRNDLSNSRILYVSATGATEPTNLSYLERLGLWGPGTAFSNLNKFINEVVSGGVAVMEMIAADMKAMGAYMARSLSFDGVTYDRLEHSLTPQQQQIYNVYSKSWQKVLQNIDEALEAAGAAKSGSARSGALAAFWSANQRFFNQILTSLQMPSLIKDIEKQLAAGNSIVLQLTSTNEAQLTRELSGMEEEDALEDLDLTPTEIISQFVENSFPVHQMEEYMDSNGNRQFRYVTDSEGNRVLNKEAVAMRDRLLDELGSIKKLDGPLDMIVSHFGPEKVAEITGRTKRLVWKEGRRVLEKRGKSHTDSDEVEFMEGKKRILVFSEAGGTGRSFHADNTAKNRQRRIHYLVQAGWRADVAIQGLGRTHRTNEASQPHYVLVSTNVPAQVRFTSTIARRLDQLGALTRGSRQTGGQGLFQAKDNLESDYAKQAITAFIFDLYRNDQIGGISFDDFKKQSGLKLTDNNGFVSENTIAAIPVPQFLNRTLSLDLDVQNELYEQVFDRLSTIIEIAAARGDLDVGMETIRAKKITEQRSDIVRTDQESGARTEYHYLIQENDAKYTAFPEKAYGYYLNEKTGKVGAVTSEARSKAGGDGIHDTYYQFSTLKNEYGDINDSQAAKLKKISKEEAKELWQTELSEAPKTVKSPLHIISGALLPVWDRLPSHRKKVVRVKTEHGKVILGRVIGHKEINATLTKLGVGGNTFDVTESIKQLIENGDEITLANNWKLRRKTVAGEKRIEVTNLEYGDQEEIKVAGGFVERIQYETRAFIPVASAPEILEKIVKSKPIVSVGNPTENAPLYSAEYLAAKYTAKAVKAGYNLLRSGVIKFADWARAMLKQFGKSIGPKLKAMFADLTAILKSRTGAISGRPASTVTGKTTGQVLNRPAKMKDFQWKKENYRTVHLEYTSPDTGKVTRVAKLLKVNNKWFWADAKREFLTLATAAKTVKSEIFEKVRNTEREQTKLIEEARARRVAKQAKATKKTEAYFSQPTAAEEVTKKELPVTVTDKISTFADRVTRALFDRRLMLKKVQKFIELATGKKLPDWANPYDRFDVIDGRIETNKNEFKDKYWQPIMADLDKAKISYEDFNNFVYAMHAPERNKYINEINPGFREKGVAGSGWTNEKAAQVKAELFAKHGEDTLMEAGKKFWAMHSELLNKQVEYGLIDEEIKGIIDAKYKYYTPLKRIKDDTVILDARALGRRSEAQDHLMFSLAAINTTFGRGEHNRVMQSFARMALLNPADQFYEIQKDKLKPYFDERTGEVQYRLDLWADRENTVHAKFGGRDVAIVVKDKDLLNAIKTKKSEAEPLFQVLRPINRILSAVNTAYNPDFTLSNIFRDVQTAGIHASEEESWEMAKNILASVPASVKTSWQHHRGIDNENTRMYKEFLREGGKTGYSEIYQLQSLAEKLEKEMAERQANGAWYKTKQGIGKFMDVVSAGNDIAESATRFAGFQAARKSGMTAQKAAVFAKNLTINFNKKGTYGTLINTAYVFGNAALQGSHLTARLTWNMAKTNKGRIALAAMIGLGAMSDFLNRLISDFDDEEGRSYYDKISSDIKDNNFIVMLPGTGGNYMSFPMAYGLNILPSLGRNASSYLFGDQTLRETGNNILGVAIGAFNPMGNDNRGILANIMPTGLKPLYDVKTNTKWSGRKIRPDQPVFGADLPKSELYFDQTSKPLVKFTQWLNEAFGGNKYESSSFLTDLSPADLQHLIETFSGGVGKTIVRGYDTVDRVVSGKPVQVENVPVIRRFIGKARDFNVYDEFRANAQIAKRVQAAKSENSTEWLNNNRESVRVNVLFKNVQKAILALRKNKSLSDETRKEKELLLQKRFNKNVREIMQKNLSKN